MSIHRSLRFASLTACCSLMTVASCDTVSFNISFAVPKHATAVDTQHVALPDGARVVVNNENGSTHISVDPAAVDARIEITRTAFGRGQAAADELLSKIVVTVTPPDGTDNVLKIDAPSPAEATSNESEFQATLIDDELNITGVLGGEQVATVGLRITLPPGHGVEVTQRIGAVRASDLDTESTLRTNNGRVRVMDAAAKVTIRTDNGSVDVEDHNGSLDIQTDNGSVEIEIRGLASDQSVRAVTDNGRIDLSLPREIDADLTAMTDDGFIRFDLTDFDHVANATATSRSLVATLNGGGPLITLETDNGLIDIEGQ